MVEKFWNNNYDDHGCDGGKLRGWRNPEELPDSDWVVWGASWRRGPLSYDLKMSRHWLLKFLTVTSLCGRLCLDFPICNMVVTIDLLYPSCPEILMC